MLDPTIDELKESIKELSAYQERLEHEVVTISKKLRLPEKKMNSVLANHLELNQIKKILAKLIERIDDKS